MRSSFLPGTWTSGGVERLFDMDAAATAVFAANQAMFGLLTSLGVHADAMAGHSTGEYSALCAARALTFRTETELLEKVRELNEIYQRTRPGSIPDGTLMAVGGIPAADVRGGRRNPPCRDA